MAKVTGWGLTNTSLGSRPKVLQEVDVPVITTATCQLKHGFVSFYERNNSLPVTDSMFCVGFPNGGKGSCLFDSGEQGMGGG